MAARGDSVARPGEAVARLLEAWRGEVEARAVYTILAERMRDPRRGQVIREIADGEARHRERIELRLRELGQPIPDPSTVRISTWLRMQARFAPVMRMLARSPATTPARRKLASNCAVLAMTFLSNSLGMTCW